ncbi:hypothetical protein [Paenibacillus sp. MBLB4367]|uniref:hypothetical protein n=1 Tax=Paenibacillus sp. MBLB4367 TaxID=3384767 RepID=UPI0039081999
MKRKLTWRTWALALSIFLMLGMLPISAAANTVEPLAGEPLATASGSATKNDWSWMTVNGTKNNTTVIYFAGSEWYVVGYNGSGVATAPDAITLFSVNGFGANAKYNNSTVGVQNQYMTSNLRTELTTGTRFTAIDERERSVMVSRLLDGVAGTQPTDPLWALSTDEANSLNTDLRIDSTGWGLRSAGANNYSAMVVNKVNQMISTYVTTAFAVRPAFHLNLASVLFTSAAEGGKPAAAGQELSVAAASVGKANLTVVDRNTDNLSLTVTQEVYNGIERNTYAPGSTVEIAYSDAKTGANKYVSCVIMDSNGRVTHYGKLSDQASGTATFTVPALADGSYTIKLFNEEYNGDKKTDYASEPVEMIMTVAKPVETSFNVTLPAGTGYTAAVQSGSSSPVDRDGSYSFKVELAPEYNLSVITVKANNKTLTPDGNGVYTISNITEHQIITVTGVKHNSTITATAKLNIQKDDAGWSGHGKSFTLKLSTDETITARMTGTDGTVKASVHNGTWKIYEGSAYTGMTITVDNTGGTATLNYYTVKFSVIDADTSK